MFLSWALLRIIHDSRRAWISHPWCGGCYVLPRAAPVWGCREERSRRGQYRVRGRWVLLGAREAEAVMQSLEEEPAQGDSKQQGGVIDAAQGAGSQETGGGGSQENS